MAKTGLPVMGSVRPYLNSARLALLRLRTMSTVPAGADATAARSASFFVGCGRSGTTILGSMFGRHPEVIYHFEPYHLWAAIDPRTDVTNLHRRVNGRFFLDEADATERARKSFARRFTLGRGDDRTVIEKTPHNVCRIGFLEALAGPGARYLHIVRSGLDVVRSIARIAIVENTNVPARGIENRWWGRWYGKWTALAREGAQRGYFADEVDRLSGHEQKGAYEWLVSLGEADRWRPVLGDRMHEITYPALAADTRRTLSEVCAFVGIGAPREWLDRAEAMMKPERRNRGGTLWLPSRMAAAFNGCMERYAFDGRAEALDAFPRVSVPGLPPAVENARSVRAVGAPAASRSGLRVLHVVPSFRAGSGAPVRTVIELTEAMSRRGHVVDVATGEDADCPQGWARGGPRAGEPRVFSFRSKSLVELMLSSREVDRLARMMECYDAVHVHTLWHPWVLQLAGAADRSGTPIVVSARGRLGDGRGREGGGQKRVYMAMGGARMIEMAGWLHCATHRELERAEPHLRGGRGVVVPNFVDIGACRVPPSPQIARRALDIPDDGTPLVVYLGRLAPKGGAGELIRAATMLATRGVKFRLVIAGDGGEDYLASLRRLAAAPELDGLTRFAGLLTGEVRLSLLRAATAVTMASRGEHFAFGCYEALACGTPVVASEDMDAAADLESSGGALLFEAGDESLAAALERVIANPDLADAMRLTGRRWVQQTMDAQRLVRMYESMYRTAGERVFSNPEPSPYVLS